MKGKLAEEFRANIAFSGVLFIALQAWCLYKAGGPQAVALMLNVVFIVTLSSGIRSISQVNRRPRSARNWLSASANLGLAMALALLIIVAHPTASIRHTLFVSLCASIGASLSDSISHDVGIFDSAVVSITSWKTVQPGQDGGISLLGSFAGGVSALLHAFLAYSLGLIEAADVPLTTAAACLGNLADSLLGSTFQQRGLLNNGTVNFLGTSTAALVVILARAL